MNVDEYKPQAIRIIEGVISDERHDDGASLVPEQLMRKQVHPSHSGLRCRAIYRIFANGCPVWILKAMFDMRTDRALDMALGRGMRLERTER